MMKPHGLGAISFEALIWFHEAEDPADESTIIRKLLERGPTIVMVTTRKSFMLRNALVPLRGMLV